MKSRMWENHKYGSVRSAERKRSRLLDLNTIHYPAFSAAEAINKKPEVNFVELCPIIDKINDIYPMSLCVYYLEWISLIEDCNDIALKYMDLYDPSIEFYARGGKFNIKNNELLLNGVAYPLRF